MSRALPLLFLSAVALAAIPGCGLALDFDPPDPTPRDGGTIDIDAFREPDAGDACGGCPTGTVCRDLTCHPACVDGEPCHVFETTCDACVDGACMNVDITCGGGSDCATAACDPVEDRCVLRDECAAGTVCVAGTCMQDDCDGPADCAMLFDECGPYTCVLGRCEPMVRPLCPPISVRSCATIDPCACEITGVDPALCASGHCDPTDALCVGCFLDSHCRGGETCRLPSRTCSDCVADGTCMRDGGLLPDARVRPPTFGDPCTAGDTCADGPCRTTMPDAFCYETACTTACGDDLECQEWVAELGATPDRVTCLAGFCNLTSSGLGTVVCE